MKKTVILFLILSCGLPMAFAQFDNMKCRNYNTSNGLPSNDVYAVYQDKYDLMWFGTPDGLSVFNGSEFENYGLPVLPNELYSVNAISAITEDEDGNLLIGTHYGYAKFMRIEKEYKYFPITFPDRANVNKFYFDSEHTIWACVGSKYGLVNVQTGTIYDAEKLNEPNFRNITNMYEVIPNVFIVSSFSYGIFLVDIQELSCRKIFPTGSIGAISHRPYAIQASSKDSIWIHSGDGIHLLTFKNDSSTDFSIQTKHPLENNQQELRQFFNLVGNNHLIYTYQNHLYSFDIQQNTISEVTDFPCNNSLAATIRVVYQDKNQNIWLGLNEMGINLLCPQKSQFQLFTSGQKYPACLSDTQVKKALEIDSTNYLLSTKGGGINLIDMRNEYCKQLHTYFNNKHITARYKDRYSLLYKTESGDYLAGNDLLGLFAIDLQNMRVTNKHKSRVLNQLKREIVTAICEDSRGNMWLGTKNSGLYHIDKLKDVIVQHYFKESNDVHTTLKSDNITSLMIDDQNRLWIGTANGLHLLNKTTLSAFSNTNMSNAIWDNQVQCLFQSSDAIIWIGTLNGLNIWDEKNASFIRLERDRNQNLNMIEAIIEDANNDIWVATKNKLMSMRNEDNSIIHLTPSDGFLNVKTATNGLIKASNNDILAATALGLFAFNPDDFLMPKSKPKQYLHKVTIWHRKNNTQKVIPLEVLDTTRSIVLDYSQNTITIEYNTLSYINADRTEFEYILEGLDNEWTWVGNNRKTTYANLPPGKYKFKFRSQNNIGVWNAEAFELAISIKPPFWQRISFRIIVISLLLLLMLYLPLLRVRKVRKQNLVLEQAIAERTKELKEQHDQLKKQTEELQEANATKDKLFRILAHDLKDPFNQILGFSELLLMNFNKYDDQKKFSRIKLIHTSAKRFYGLLENILSWSRAHNKRISYHPGDILLKPIIDDAINFLNDIANNKHIEIIIDVPERLVVHADKYLLATVVRNLTSNAIKFSYKGSRINIFATPFDKLVKISIRDYGVGMDKASRDNLFSKDFHQSKSGTIGESGTGLGLIICKDFIERNQGSLDIVSNPDEGSTFSFTLPVVER